MSISARGSVEIINRLGMHARAASVFVETASGFQSEVWVTRSGNRVNGKSIMGVLMLAASCGTTIDIEAIGVDAEQALVALVSLVSDRFGEEQ